MMRRSKIDHLLRAAASVTGHRTFVLVGSTVVLVRCRNIPADMLLTPEIDLYVPDIPDQEDISDRIAGSIGQGSRFHDQYGYYADGVSSGTSVMPRDWRLRATSYEGPGCPGVTAIVPEQNDVALAKLVAWREKDRDWLQSGLRAGLFSLTDMQSRLDRMPESAPAIDELRRRLSFLAATCGIDVDR
ncbi:hypothetical protein SAMN02799631_01915 [Methylobacterium sp. 174MFSha1.1]|uniref:DUF6036 family nucleotidyltransferase n=1 Tax=Methylobacterium sp. 174MFSha1.1 TaxID=1502749 RepID=UPI0008E4D9F9|nr:DUF6036 family nucleotidyltransferase [Methylobacterium sp. 174MFSha1.1]SFU71370.1 hypothetical protein SAMN02799631_01915 [Methylobacterium sp. 174MFSha1.1]